MTPVARCQPKTVWTTCPTPACGCTPCVPAQRTTIVEKVVVAPPPIAAEIVTPAYVAPAVPAPVAVVPSPVPAVPAPIAKEAAPISSLPVSPPAPKEAAPTPESPAPTPAAPAASPYATCLQTMQTNQENDARAIQEMLEHRQANLALIRRMQEADAQSVAAFEKLVHQLKGLPPKAGPAPTPASTVAPPVVPAIPTTPIPPVVAPAPPAAPTGPSPKEVQALMEELDRLSQKVKELSGQPQATPDR